MSYNLHFVLRVCKLLHLAACKQKHIHTNLKLFIKRWHTSLRVNVMDEVLQRVDWLSACWTSGVSEVEIQQVQHTWQSRFHVTRRALKGKQASFEDSLQIWLQVKVARELKWLWITLAPVDTLNNACRLKQCTAIISNFTITQKSMTSFLSLIPLKVYSSCLLIQLSLAIIKFGLLIC